MKKTERFIGACSKYIDKVGWTTDIPVDQINEKGYVKVENGSVVLSKEEYEGLQMAKDFNYGYHEGEKNMTSYYENLKLPEARKETAKEILTLWARENRALGYNLEYIDEIAYKYGVGVEE